jgi:hypothetical protein
MDRLPLGIGPAGEEVTESVHLQNEVPIEATLKDKMDASKAQS